MRILILFCFCFCFSNIETFELCSDGDLRCAYEVFNFFCRNFTTTGKIAIKTGKRKVTWQTTILHVYEHKGKQHKGYQLNSAATLASQAAVGHSLSLIITIVIMTLG